MASQALRRAGGAGAEADAAVMDMLEAMEGAALAAGAAAAALQCGERGDGGVERREKSASWDLVTQGDLLSQRIAVEALRGRGFATPAGPVAFLLEEGAEPDDPLAARIDERGCITDERAFFTVDPIDGTSNYASGGRDWSVAIGFVEAAECRLAVLHFPRRGETLAAAKGRGVYRHAEGRVERVGPLAGRPLGECLVGAEMGGFIGAHWLQRLLRFPERSLGLRNVFSTTGNVCDMLHGVQGCVLHLRGGWIWDFAPTSLCVLEAGGCVCNERGEGLVLDTVLGTKFPTGVVFSSHADMQLDILSILRDDTAAAEAEEGARVPGPG
mmetsp:Transcript_33707/g.106541  ORF Transcript_33707/g.106541 Transcript_33707/m.106541 type:complete len:327 (-) Transcript_33707:55-1035(-)